MNYEALIGWGMAGLFCLGIAWAPVACTMSNNAKIEAAIQSGIEPMKARCAYSVDPDRVQCAVIAAQLSKEKQP